MNFNQSWKATDNIICGHKGQILFMYLFRLKHSSVRQIWIDKSRNFASKLCVQTDTSNAPHVRLGQELVHMDDSQLYHTERTGLNPDNATITLLSISSSPIKTREAFTHSPHIQDNEEDMVPIFNITGNYPVLTMENENNLPGIYEYRVKCSHYNYFIQQTYKEIGFIPFTNLHLYTGPEKQWEVIPDVIQAHKIIKSSGMPNFLSYRLSVQGPL